MWWNIWLLLKNLFYGFCNQGIQTLRLGHTDLATRGKKHLTPPGAHVWPRAARMPACTSSASTYTNYSYPLTRSHLADFPSRRTTYVFHLLLGYPTCISKKYWIIIARSNASDYCSEVSSILIIFTIFYAAATFALVVWLKLCDSTLEVNTILVLRDPTSPIKYFEGLTASLLKSFRFILFWFGNYGLIMTRLNWFLWWAFLTVLFS